MTRERKKGSSLLSFFQSFLHPVSDQKILCSDINYWLKTFPNMLGIKTVSFLTDWKNTVFDYNKLASTKSSVIYFLDAETTKE